MTTDQSIIRELAKAYMNAACSEEQQKANKRMRDTNDLKIVRPPVLIDEIPWKELDSDPDLICLCENEQARTAEQMLRRKLYCKKHFHADMLMETQYKVTMAFDSNPVGVARKETATSVNGRSFADVLYDESSSELINAPSYTLRPDLDEQRIHFFSDLFGDTMPVQLTGHGPLYSAFWDDISFLRGVEPIYEDLYDRPEHLHRIMQKMVARTKAKMDFIEQYSQVDAKPVNLHCTPAMISGLAQNGWKATWYRGMAQLFSCISPEMFKEFELD
ncbi:MAG: hypothetical protein IKM24_06705, partial [Clostridia bacterium]|nr:hypothetical protein [Clostridia bacterium]